MQAELTTFFNGYQAAWDGFDGEAIARHYHAPVTIQDGDGLHHYPTQEALVSKFVANCARFRELGYQGSTLVIDECLARGEAAATLDIGWRVTLAAGPLNFRTTYLCATVGQDWRIIAAVAYASGNP